MVSIFYEYVYLCGFYGICDSRICLLSAFSPVAAFFLALVVNARHLFYGLSMLDKYKNTGWKKFYLIFGMCDESFTVNCTVTPPDDVDQGLVYVLRQSV